MIVCPIRITAPPALHVSSKFTRIGRAPTFTGPRSRLQFINEQQGWIAQDKNLWQTQDGGKSWALVYQIHHNLSGEFDDIHFANANDGWATMTQSLYKTRDGGRNWTRVGTPMDALYGSLWAFHLESNGKTGWLAGGVFEPMKLGDPCMNNAQSFLPHSARACLNGAVFRTDDSGLSWQPQNIPQYVGRFMSITFTDPNHVWVAGDAGVFHTTNGGRTWSSDKFRRECEDYYALPDRYPAATTFVDDMNGWLVLSSGQIAKSNDGGKTWCDLFDPENLWPNDGRSGPSGHFRNFHFRDANHGIGLGHDRLVYESLDGGLTWRREGTAVKFESIEFFDNANGWAISKDQELYRVRLEETAQDFVAPKEEPRQLIDIFTGEESLSYQGYVVRKFYKKVSDEIKSDIEVSYAALMKNNRRLLKFDGVYFGEGNDTQFGLFDLLGQESEQIIVSQTVPRGGRHWVVSVSPDVRVLFDSRDFGVGREEFYVIDLDKDGVYEIVLLSTKFYRMQDKMYIAEIPLTEIVFKYDAKARRYLPANDRFIGYTLRGIEHDIENLRSDEDSNYLSKRLRILLRYVYARKQREGWAFFAQAYQRADRKEIVTRIRSVLKDDPLYNYLY